MKDRNEHADGRTLANETPTRRSRRDDAFSEFLPGALDRTLGVDGAPRRHKDVEPGTPSSGNA